MVNCSEFFRNVTVFGRKDVAFQIPVNERPNYRKRQERQYRPPIRLGHAPRHRREERIHCRDGLKQLDHLQPPVWSTRRAGAAISTNRQSMLRRNQQLEGYTPATTSSISCAHGVIARPFIVMPETV